MRKVHVPGDWGGLEGSEALREPLEAMRVRMAVALAGWTPASCLEAQEVCVVNDGGDTPGLDGVSGERREACLGVWVGGIWM